MAPRKQTSKQAAENIGAADANGDAKPPKKRKVAAASTAKTISEEPKQLRAGLRRTRKEKHEANEDQVMTNEASTAKKTRVGKAKNVAAPPKTTAETKSRSNKIKKIEKATQSHDPSEQISAEQVVVKKSSQKIGAAAKKAGTKEEVAAKAKSKVPPAKKQKSVAITENGAEDDVASEHSEKDVVKRVSAKRTRVKTVEKKSAAPAARTTAIKAPRKRKNAENTNEANIAEAEDAQIAEEEEIVPDKKLRSRTKKADDELKMKSKGEVKKNNAKAEIVKPLSEEAEIEEQDDHNTAVQEDNKTAKNTKNTKKLNVKKTVPRGKRNAAMEKINDTQAAAAVMPEADIEENGDAETIQIKKRKNTGKANGAREKTEVKGRQKKGQISTKPVDEKETTKNATVEDDIEKVNASEKLNGANGTRDVLSSESDNNLEEEQENDKAEKDKFPESIRIVESTKKEPLDDKANIITEENEN